MKTVKINNVQYPKTLMLNIYVFFLMLRVFWFNILYNIPDQLVDVKFGFQELLVSRLKTTKKQKSEINRI